MKLNYVTKDIKLTDDLKQMAESKLHKLDKYFHDEQQARVVFKKEKDKARLEVTIILDKGVVLRAEESNEDIKTAIDKVEDALARQIRKHKTKLQKRFTESNSIRFEAVEENNDKEIPTGAIVKTKEFGIKPMDKEEAIMQMELIDHDFFVFLDSKTNNVNVVYKRKDGNYGLLVPGFEK